MPIDSATAFLAPYFRFVRIGAKRVSVSTSAKTWTPVAFVNADGGNVVVIKTTNGAASAEATMSGLAAGRYGVRTIDFGRNVKDLPDVTTGGDGVLSVTIPAGITTVYGKATGVSSVRRGVRTATRLRRFVPLLDASSSTTVPDEPADVAVGALQGADALPGAGPAEPSAMDDRATAVQPRVRVHT